MKHFVKQWLTYSVVRALEKLQENLVFPEALSRKLQNLNDKPYGRPKALSETDCRYVRERILEYAKWGKPLKREDVRDIVQHYLNERCKTD